MTQLAIPTIHMNGTSKADLLEGLCKQMAACRRLMETMQENGPNGRDYYVQEVGAFTRAQDEHRRRFKAVNGVLQELEMIAEGIA